MPRPLGRFLLRPFALAGVLTVLTTIGMWIGAVVADAGRAFIVGYWILLGLYVVAVLYSWGGQVRYLWRDDKSHPIACALVAVVETILLTLTALVAVGISDLGPAVADRLLSGP